MSLKTLNCVAWAVAVLGCFAASAEASFIYGDKTGNTVVYLGVTEDSTTDPGVQLFGAPTVSPTSDALVFTPVSFGALATGLGGFDITDGTLTTTVAAKPGYHIDKFRFDESGDYTLAGIGTANTWASVSAPLFVKVLEINGVGVDPGLYSYTTNLVFTPSGGSYDLVHNPHSGVWSGSGEVDLSALVGAGGGGATKIAVSLDNQLLAFSEAGTIAYIKKKQGDAVTLTAETSPVPEPSTLALLGIAALGLLTFVRRR